MIIDKILDRKDGKYYTSKSFYRSIEPYGDDATDIIKALDEGTETDVRFALALYVLEYGYNPEIVPYIYSVNWLDQ